MISEYTDHDITLAVREIASYFPALSSCDADVLKFLKKKLRAYLKQQRHHIKRKSLNDPSSKQSSNESEKLSEQSDIDTQSDAENTLQPNLPTAKLVPSSDKPEQPLCKSSEPTESPGCHKDGENPAPSLRKRSLLEASKPTEATSNTDSNIPDGYLVNSSSPNAKKAKKSTSGDPTCATGCVTNADMPKEFCSQNPQNVKFEEGHFVVLGEDIDQFHFCKIDNIEYHKSSGKYFMGVTYYNLIDGRLEVCPKPGRNIPWTASKVPLNTVILNLRHTRLVDNDVKKRISEITKDLYS